MAEDVLAAVIGVFDGVHRGHVVLIRSLVEEASRRGLRPVAVTFEPPPALYFNPHFHFLLSTKEEKRERLEALGVEPRFLDFADVAAKEPEEFIEEELAATGVRLVAVGEGFRFGRKRRGDVAMLEGWSGLEVMALPKERMEAEPISATRIRELLLLGHIRRASALLGYHYRLSGRPVSGLGRAAALLDTPTVNIEPVDPHKLVPPDGVYAVWYGKDRRRGVCYIGSSPTFGEETHKIEVHLLEGPPDERTEPVVCFAERLRPELRFASLEELKTQVKADVEQARRVLSQS